MGSLSAGVGDLGASKLMAANEGDVKLDVLGGRGVESERLPLISCHPLCVPLLICKIPRRLRELNAS